MSIKQLVVGALAAGIAVVAAASPGYADGAVVVSKHAPQGGVVSASPFTWSGSQDGVALTASFTPLGQVASGSLAAVQGTFTFTNLATGAAVDVVGSATVEADRSVLATVGQTGSPTSTTYVYPASQLSTSVCGNCVAAAGVAAAAAAAACIFTLGWGCAVAWGLATAGATAYCGSNPCNDGTPSCQDSSWAGPADNAAGPGYNLEVNSLVNCSKDMSDITITSYKVYKDGTLWDSGSYPTCYNVNYCYMATYYSNAPTGCYTNVFSWSGDYHDPNTNQTLTYGDSNVTSQQGCV